MNDPKPDLARANQLTIAYQKLDILSCVCLKDEKIVFHKFISKFRIEK